jgi:tetratricopeptide (TPR) repeat protein
MWSMERAYFESRRKYPDKDEYAYLFLALRSRYLNKGEAAIHDAASKCRSLDDAIIAAVEIDFGNHVAVEMRGVLRNLPACSRCGKYRALSTIDALCYGCRNYPGFAACVECRLYWDDYPKVCRRCGGQVWQITDVLDELAPIWTEHQARPVHIDDRCPSPDSSYGEGLEGSHAQEQAALRRYNEGVALANSGHYEAAIEKFDRAVVQLPEFEEAWFNKGEMLRALGRWEEAIFCYDQAPGMFQAWCNKGALLRARDNNEGSLAAYEQALRLKMDDKVTWLNRGVALTKLTRHQEALASYDRALAIDPRYADAWVNKAGLLGQLRRYDEASECFDQGLGLNPSDFLGWYSKAKVLADQARLTEAVLCYENALALNSNLDHAWVEKGLCL